MKIKINKKSLYALSEILSKVGVSLTNEVTTTKDGFAALHGDFLDPSYDSYSSEYTAVLCKINQHCEDLQIFGVRAEEHYKKLADL